MKVTLPVALTKELSEQLPLLSVSWKHLIDWSIYCKTAQIHVKNRLYPYKQKDAVTYVTRCQNVSIITLGASLS